ncbi:phage integrase family protein [Paraburkholderia hospita]|uniref:phage integrase family protein n=1 Tax=Paraburkholderia hospita TaxID=169430 RepID=UPI003BFA3267
MPGGTATAELHTRDDVLMLDMYRDQVDRMACTARRNCGCTIAPTFPSVTSPRVDRKIARNARLRARQAARLPAGIGPRRDAPAYPPARRLVRARRGGTASRRGANTLAHLLALIRRRRQHWRTAVPRFGPKGAQRITGCRCMPRHWASCRLLRPRRGGSSEPLIRKLHGHPNWGHRVT